MQEILIFQEADNLKDMSSTHFDIDQRELILWYGTCLILK